MGKKGKMVRRLDLSPEEEGIDAEGISEDIIEADINNIVDIKTEVRPVDEEDKK